MIARRGPQCAVAAWPHRFRHHFSHTWLDRAGTQGNLMELNGRSSPPMLRRYGASFLREVTTGLLSAERAAQCAIRGCRTQQHFHSRDAASHPAK